MIISTLASLAVFDTIAFLPLAIVAGLVVLWRRRRPFTRARVMDVALSVGLLVMMGARYAFLAVMTVMMPAAVLGGEATPAAAGIATALYALVALIGFLAYRGGVGWRVGGTLVFAVATLTETVMNAAFIGAGAMRTFDTLLSVAIAAAMMILAAFHWTYRTATPNPLGSTGRPYDY
ncbi:hypothetical protein L1787_02755 [Acuticoccus sp. M5D2P5]|uniref:hypothetical protein n=1 Tax=Acuticoccus kalidii TaxID=2910977 RepID=UPI001F4233BC|nr:hypothetical protein [Acuticoccus kalidii]MCF3932333.1 hypothetical protein [Acuticoccus kalidii]